MICTYRAVRTLADFAVERARKRQRPGFDKPRIHFVFKRNILTEAAVSWIRAENEIRDEYGNEIDVMYEHADAFGMKMLKQPELFDVIVTENLFGDILSDQGAELSGGIQVGVSGNLNLDGRFPSMFEPIHGSAPDKWFAERSNGRFVAGNYDPELVQQVKPEGAFLSYAMMLEHLGESGSPEPQGVVQRVNHDFPEEVDVLRKFFLADCR